MDQIVLENLDTGTRITKWISYSFNSNFLSPTDAWTLVVSPARQTADVVDAIDSAVISALQPGSRVQLQINGKPQATGRIDETSLAVDRQSGAVLTVTGRDMMGPVVDANMDPRRRFPESAPLGDVLQSIFADFGLPVVVATNDVNRQQMSGVRGGRQTGRQGFKDTKQSKRAAISRMIHRTKPYPNEGAFEFACRIAQREGVWIWPAAAGDRVIVGRPDFTQAPSFVLSRMPDGHGNVIGGTVHRSVGAMPSLIIAQGFGGGYEFPHSRLTAKMVNPLIGLDPNGAMWPDVQKIWTAWPDAKETKFDFTFPASTYQRPPCAARAMFMYDEESKTPAQLQNFVRREMALKMRQALTAQYVVDGHSQDGVVWNPDMIVTVDDDLGGIHTNMWILSRTFTKDRRSGTLTQLELILPGTLEFFGPVDSEDPSGADRIKENASGEPQWGG